MTEQKEQSVGIQAWNSDSKLCRILGGFTFCSREEQWQVKEVSKHQAVCIPQHKFLVKAAKSHCWKGRTVPLSFTLVSFAIHLLEAELGVRSENPTLNIL